jgi:hypothetical protein
VVNQWLLRSQWPLFFWPHRFLKLVDILLRDLLGHCLGFNCWCLIFVDLLSHENWYPMKDGYWLNSTTCYRKRGAIVIVWQLDLQLPVQSVPITTKLWVQSSSCALITALSDNVYQWLATVLWFSPGTQSSDSIGSSKSNYHTIITTTNWMNSKDITEGKIHGMLTIWKELDLELCTHYSIIW